MKNKEEDKLIVATLGSSSGEVVDVVDNLKDVVLKDSRLCHFVADLMAGRDIDEAVKANFKIDIPAVVINDEVIIEVCELLGWELEHWDSVKDDVYKLCNEIAKGDVSGETLLQLCRALTYEDAIIDAEQRGYVRGRNDKIELVKRGVDDESATNVGTEKGERNKSILGTPRRSIWDK